MTKRARDDDRDPNSRFLGEQLHGGTGNAAGPELALYRFVRWVMTRGRSSR